MKPLPIIITIVLATICVVKLANTCSKREQREKTNEFLQERFLIEDKRQAIFSYSKSSADSLNWMATHKQIFDEALDSSIKRHTVNYFEDEKQNKAYLNTLYSYKKLSYLYSDWIKHEREYAVAVTKDSILHSAKFRSFYMAVTSVMHNIHMGKSGNEY